ncbi:MAG: DUF3604 domain-containing protein [Gammaproteobacteria bacterium]|nr:DUF3604 domain-containing protein [Gammaproteobacteria bacterium]
MKINIGQLAGVTMGLMLVTGCGESPETVSDGRDDNRGAPAEAVVAGTATSHTTAPVMPEANPLRNAYFGDLHMHTALSVDAYITNTRTLPDDAYRYAKGEAIDHVSGGKIQLSEPLDFMAVTDHAEIIGVARAMDDPNDPLSKTPLAADITSDEYSVSHKAFATIVAAAATGTADELLPREVTVPAVSKGWKMVQEAAKKHYEPGKFTTFVGYEWSSMPQMANLHRNVIFKNANVPPFPFSSTNSPRPEDLWSFLENWRQKGDDVLAIPHNSNASKGLMYPLEDSFGNPITDEYARRRVFNEPITEVTQFKGTSEVHPALSDTDEFAGFEIWNTVVGGTAPVTPDRGGYVRSAYQRGLKLQEEKGFNPYKFGLIGSSDSHNASTAVEEDNFTGGHGNADMTAELRLNSKPSTLTASSLNFSASGLAGVWATENTREALFDAIRAKETFATTGPRIRVRFFAGVYPEDLTQREDMLTQAYENGVPMGSDLVVSADSVPAFLVWASKDPRGTNLQRVQVIKGWVDNGEEKEAIFDVACADGLVPDAATHRCPHNNASVNLVDCSVSPGKGAAELMTLWRDPEFDAASGAVYYVRVLENPSCRWSTWDAIRMGVSPPANKPATLQERAFSSPIWVSMAPVLAAPPED